ncbi:hypothetical protein AAZV13_20G006900 [Glycine max]
MLAGFTVNLAREFKERRRVHLGWLWLLANNTCKFTHLG